MYVCSYVKWISVYTHKLCMCGYKSSMNICVVISLCIYASKSISIYKYVHTVI